ncbi:MAG TPA: LuxR family transcriptional regulator [Candidatus Kapabacteria bacterium]|nr:LuxR family transcriptional regulator [Candidatus Kapabacteria bacterium]
MTQQYKKFSDRSLEYFYKDPNIAIEAAEKGYALAKRNRNTKQLAHFVQRQVNIYRERGNIQKLIELNDELRRHYTKMNYKVGLASCYHNDSFIAIREGRLDAGLDAVRKGFELLEDEPNDQIFVALHTSQGYIEILKGNTVGALRSLYLAFESEPKLTESHSEAERIWILSSSANRESNLGICYIMGGNAEKGRQHLLHAREQFILLNNTTNYIYTLSSLGQLEREKGQYETAIPFLDEALCYARKNKAIPKMIEILTELAQCYLYLFESSKGRAFLDEAIRLSDEHSMHTEIVAITSAKFFIEATNYMSVHSILCPFIEDESIPIGNKLDIFFLLSEACSKLKRWEEAFVYQRQYQQVYEKLNDQKKLWLAAELEIEYENRQRKKQMELLEQYSQQQQEDIAAQAIQLLKHREFLDELRQDLSGGRKATHDILKDITTELSRNDEWTDFEIRFTQSHGQKMKALKKAYPALTTTELKVCALLCTNLSTKAISSVLSMSPRTVEWHRAKIRKKLKVKPTTDLTSTLQSIK